ncbi:uncharacterized protein LOC142182201 [Nicotiana tabacum]|uniref:Uncharacterized protein LOC142182201 n=1 Tax=Nicotiana tabacum TaxID=4097 RepID=A0AC58US85_TOBAC
MLVTKQFNGTCFGAWRRGIIIALSAKKKIDFINDPDISQSVIYSKTTKGLWDDLNQRYGQSNGARMYEVQKDLSSVSQGSHVSEYFNKVKRFWDEMEFLNTESYCVCECNCGGKHKMIKRDQNLKLMQLLMSLNKIFNNARGNILMMEPLPDVSKAYSLVIQDEKQRDSGATDHMTSNKTLPTNVVNLPIPILVTLPNGYKVKGFSLKKPLGLGKMAEGLYLLNSNTLNSTES